MERKKTEIGKYICLYAKKQHAILSKQSSELGFNLKPYNGNVIFLTDVSETALTQLKILAYNKNYHTSIMISKTKISTNNGPYVENHLLANYLNEAITFTHTMKSVFMPFKALFGDNKNNVNELADEVVRIMDKSRTELNSQTAKINSNKYVLTLVSVEPPLATDSTSHHGSHGSCVFPGYKRYTPSSGLLTGCQMTGGNSFLSSFTHSTYLNFVAGCPNTRQYYKWKKNNGDPAIHVVTSLYNAYCNTKTYVNILECN